MKRLDWTHVPAKIDTSKLAIYSLEISKLWQLLTQDMELTKSRFFFAVLNDLYKNTCPELMEELKRLGVYEYCQGSGFFAVPPGQQTPVHIDLGFNCVLNFPVFNCDNSYTVWYKDLEEIKISKELSYVESDTVLNKEHREEISQKLFSEVDEIPYFKFDPAKEIDRVESNQALWINGAIPHRPEVLHNQFRLVATFRFLNLPDYILLENLGFLPQ